MKPHGSDPQEYLDEHPKLRSWLDKTGSFGEEDQDLLENWKQNLALIDMEYDHVAEHLKSDPDSDVHAHLQNLLLISHSQSYLLHWLFTYRARERGRGGREIKDTQ